MPHTKTIIILIFCTLCSLSNAQFDSLHFEFEGRSWSEKIQYPPKPDTNYFVWQGSYPGNLNQTAITIPYKRGKPSGLVRAYYPNGQKLFRVVYGWGKLHGDWIEFDESGTVTVKGQYRDDLRHGVWYFAKERLRGKYRKGKKHGKWKYYSGRRVVAIEKFFRGRFKSRRTFRE